MLRYCTPALGCYKVSAKHGNCMLCSAMQIQYLASDFEISQLFTLRFNDFQHNDKHSMVFHVICELKF